LKVETLRRAAHPNALGTRGATMKRISPPPPNLRNRKTTRIERGSYEGDSRAEFSRAPAGVVNPVQSHHETRRPPLLHRRQPLQPEFWGGGRQACASGGRRAANATPIFVGGGESKSLPYGWIHLR